MKVVPLCIFLFALLQETKHQLFPYYYYPPLFHIQLANEEFIEAEVPVTTPIPAPTEQKDVPPPPVETSGGVDISNVPIPPSSGQIPVDVDTANVEKPNNVEHNKNQPEEPQQRGNVAEVVENTVASGDTEAIPVPVAPLSLNDTASSPPLSTTNNGSQEPPLEPLVPSEDKEKGEKEEGDKEKEDPIPSFMEWTQKKQLEQELKGQAPILGGTGGSGGTAGVQKNQINGNGQGRNGIQGQNGSGSGSQSVPPAAAKHSIDAKNFASPDCGAKIVQANPEAQNAGGVLSSSPDEYMLNKCGTSIWFVVELCEPLTIERISLGNLELFSSSPKDVEFGISDRYPTRDWVRLGPVSLPDSRAVHPVDLLQTSTNTSTFGKFVKVSVLSHYGGEHYCPISQIKVNGKSEYEVLESETTRQDHDSTIDGGSLYEEPILDPVPPLTTEGDKNAGIKETVMNIFNKAVQTITRGRSASDGEQEEGRKELLKSRCLSLRQCVPKSALTPEIYRLLSCNSTDLLPFLARNLPWCGWDYCHATFETKSIGLPWQPEGFFASLFSEEPVVLMSALCHYLKPMKEGCDPSCLAQMNVTDEFVNESMINNNNVTNVSMGGGEGIDLNTPEQSTKKSDDDSFLPVTAHDQQLSLEAQTGLPRPNIPDSSDMTGTTASPSDQKQQVDSPPIPDLSHQQHQQQIEQPAEVPPNQEQTQIPAPPPIPPEEGMNNNNNNNFQTTPGTPVQPQQKESVFVRLTNRIKTLERNQTLTASYLDELSKRFKKQSEESSSIVEGNKKTLNETKAKILQMEEFNRLEVHSLRRNLEDVRERLFNVHLQRSLLVVICLSQTLLLAFIIFWVKKKCAELQNQLDASLHREARRASMGAIGILNENWENKNIGVGRRESDPTAPSLLVPIRPRSNSDSGPPSEKSKKLKNKKNKNKQQGKSDSIPKSQSGDVVSLSPKENVDPKKFRTSSLERNPNHIPSLQKPFVSIPPNGSHRLTKSSSPSPPSSLSFLPGSVEITTSSRFALLASPMKKEGSVSPIAGRKAFPSPSTLSSFYQNRNDRKQGRSGSIESTSSSISTSSMTTQSLTKGVTLANGGGGHTSRYSQSLKQGNKGKKVGLKAFMPKIFDR